MKTFIQTPCCLSTIPFLFHLSTFPPYWMAVKWPYHIIVHKLVTSQPIIRVIGDWSGMILLFWSQIISFSHYLVLWHSKITVCPKHMSLLCSISKALLVFVVHKNDSHMGHSAHSIKISNDWPFNTTSLLTVISLLEWIWKVDGGGIIQAIIKYSVSIEVIQIYWIRITTLWNFGLQYSHLCWVLFSRYYV